MKKKKKRKGKVESKEVQMFGQVEIKFNTHHPSSYKIQVFGSDTTIISPG